MGRMEGRPRGSPAQPAIGLKLMSATPDSRGKVYRAWCHRVPTPTTPAFMGVAVYSPAGRTAPVDFSTEGPDMVNMHSVRLLAIVRALSA